MTEAVRRSTVLVLGGTAEAREIADALQHAGIAVVSSLAGRTANPRKPTGETRVGGFGGRDGLADWLRERHCAAVIDATHPFSTRISESAVAASVRSGVPLIRLERPGWVEHKGDRWHWVDDLESAAMLAPKLGTRVLLSIGRQRLDAFAAIPDTWFLIRCIDPPVGPLPANHEILLARGPFTLEHERKLIRRHAIDLVVTRDSGGAATQAKAIAAREHELPVIVIRRPRLPETATVERASQAIAWTHSVCSAGQA